MSTNRRKPANDPATRTRPPAAPPGLLSARRGRPRKFGVPSRPVTVTLPEPVIEALEAVDPDLSRAIVRLAQPEIAKQPHPAAEIARFGPHGVIVVNPTRTLERRTGVTLVPLPDGRALISFARSITPAHIELMLADALDDPDLAASDRAIFAAIQDILRSVRKTRGASIEQRSIIVLESERRAAAPPVSPNSAAVRSRRGATVSTRTLND